jgi:hypothetical protein
MSPKQMAYLATELARIGELTDYAVQCKLGSLREANSDTVLVCGNAVLGVTELRELAEAFNIVATILDTLENPDA